MERSYNFAAGPAMLPLEVMHKAQQEFIDFQAGMSVMELSHRHAFFTDIADQAKKNLTKLYNIPSNYKILWSTGGATGHFGLIPLNLLHNQFCNKNITADYLCTGIWSNKAAAQASRYLTVNKALDNKQSDYTSIKPRNSWNLSDNPRYIYYTPNETISGVAFSKQLDPMNFLSELSLNNTFLVADMTSCILSKPIDISKYGIIFASAQKNLGPSGVTLIIIRDDLLIENTYVPDVFSYKKLAASDSRLNTPPTFNIYMVNLVLQWLIDSGGLQVMEDINRRKAKKLYDFIDTSELFYNKIDPECRSLMNVTFSLHDTSLEDRFIQQAQENKLYFLEGHRSLGGFRASIYNAMPEQGVDYLIDFMAGF